MTIQNTDLTGLLGSRICHDLISPIGAIDNGLELLAMSSGTSGPELDLISGSVVSAKARILYYRISFGMCDSAQMIGSNELSSVIAGYTSGFRMSVALDCAGDLPRIDAKIVCLLLLCCETAMPFGGQVQVSRTPSRWRISGRADKLNIDPFVWSMLTDETPQMEPTPKLVHFPLLAQLLKQTGRAVQFDHTPQEFTLQV